ncbi:MAG: hypothetical protein ACQETH_03170, partial [Candidatus Rifleibacteriota bacterium]
SGGLYISRELLILVKSNSSSLFDILGCIEIASLCSQCILVHYIMTIWVCHCEEQSDEAI